MRLVAGARLGPYEIQSAIGAGGMGEVYKARDTRLDRTVAIKILPAELSADPDRRVRFEREARAVAALSHPHICTLHDIGTHEGTTFLVMEYLPGESLAERLLHGPLPLAQALEIGAQIAEALDVAHKHGIIHRDLKPGNVMLTTGGMGRSGAVSAKLLDFGLAKLAAHGERPALVSGASAATRSLLMTARGAIIGTLQYMAPEQLEGKEADARTDLWALGALLYEMLTGKRAFEADSDVSLIGAILNTEPAALATLQPLTPPFLVRVVTKCLSKRPDDRFDTAHDVADELHWIAQSSASSLPVAVRQTPRRVWLTRVGWGTAVAALTLLAALAGARFGVPGWGPPQGTATESVAHLDIFLPQDAPFWIDPQGFPPALALSPDGSVVAYTCTRGDLTQICLRRLDRQEVSPIPGSEGGRFPTFSPDGQWVAFCVAVGYTFCDVGAPLKRISVRNGRVDPLGTIPVGVDAPLPFAWPWDNKLLVSGHGGVWQVPVSGGAARAVVTVDKARGEQNFAYPGLLPDGLRMVISVSTRERGQMEMEARVVTVATGEQQLLRRDAHFAHYLPTGHLVFLDGKYPGVLSVATFDPATLELGRAVPLWEPVRMLPELPALALARNGTLLYLPIQAERVLKWVDRQQRSMPAFPLRGPWQSPRLSPDGRRVAVEVARDQTHPGIEVIDLTRGVISSIGVPAGRNPLWTPDGTRIVFGSLGMDEILSQSADGSGTPEVMHKTNVASTTSGSWSADGRLLAYWSSAEEDFAIWTLSKESSTWTPRRFLPLPGTEAPGGGAPRFSPDGRWIAYESRESGTINVYVRAYPSGDRRTQISPAGGHDAVWSSDGRELFYRDGDRFFGVPVTLTPDFKADAARLLFTGPYLDSGAYVGKAYDVSRDGQRFLVVEVNDEERTPRRFHLVQNWFEELKAKVPAGGAGK